MFGNFNFSEIGQHAEQLKGLLTGILNSVQESRDAHSAMRVEVADFKGTLAKLIETNLQLVAENALLREKIGSQFDAPKPIDLGDVDIPVSEVEEAPKSE